MELPVVDVSALRASGGDGPPARAVAAAIDGACRAHGFFYVAGHGIGAALVDDLQRSAAAFFALPAEEKERISMVHGGRAWRGWFPPGGELTSGVPDGKEGLYFGAELGLDHPAVREQRPLHGPNLFPVRPEGLRAAVLAWLDEIEAVAQLVLEGVALGLGLDRGWFRRTLTANPTPLFRIFHYPPAGTVPRATWGVAEHTDYGLLTVLLQDDTGGLEVHTPDGWLPAPPLPGTFVCNIGDMLERMTGGAYRSTPHRVLPPQDRGRLSFPFFLDPGWDVVVAPVPGMPERGAEPGRARARWDGADLSAFAGPYGGYLTAKVAKVFPAIADGLR